MCRADDNRSVQAAARATGLAGPEEFGSNTLKDEKKKEGTVYLGDQVSDAENSLMGGPHGESQEHIATQALMAMMESTYTGSQSQKK